MKRVPYNIFTIYRTHRVKLLQVQVTTPSKTLAHFLSEALLKEKPIACFQVFAPVESHYWWKVQIEHSQEYMCLMKTQEHGYEKVKRIIADLHSYEVPEVIITTIIGGFPSSLKWITENISGLDTDWKDDL